jgi:AcrR family transcriptional regulator
MTKNEIQEERMKGYFLSAAKDIIRAEGVGAVSARSVAERAGYSYATLYNYFNDVRDLVFSCVNDFMEECRQFVAQEAGGPAPGAGRLLAVSRGYAKFFVQYPGIFALMYTHKPGEIGTAASGIGTLGEFFESLAQPFQARTGGKNEAALRRTHGYALNGLLMLYLNRRVEMSYEAFMAEVDGLAGQVPPVKR